MFLNISLFILVFNLKHNKPRNEYRLISVPENVLSLSMSKSTTISEEISHFPEFPSLKQEPPSRTSKNLARENTAYENSPVNFVLLQQISFHLA